MKKINKGEYGYINNQKIITIIRTVILFALALGLYFAGIINTGSNKNLLTVVAILGLLPASKSCVNMIMFLRFKSLDKEFYSEIVSVANSLCSDDFLALYENVLTTTEKSYYLPVIYYKNHTIISFCDNKSNDALAIIENHIKESIKLERIDVTVKVFKDKDQFIERLKGLIQVEKDEGDDSRLNTIYNTLKAISL